MATTKDIKTSMASDIQEVVQRFEKFTKKGKSKKKGNFPLRQYHPIHDTKDYSAEAESFFRNMLEYKRQWGYRIKQERAELDRIISMCATRRNAIRAIERGDVEAHDVIELLEQSEPEVLGIAKDPKMTGVVDMGEAQSGCIDERPQPKKKNMFDKMYSTFTSLIFTSDANSNLTGNTTIQRQETAKKKCQKLRNAAKTFIYFYTSHGFVNECDTEQQEFRDWESVYHIWYTHVIPIIKRCQRKLTDAKNQMEYNNAFKQANQNLRTWIYHPFSFVEYADSDVVELEKRDKAYEFIQNVPLLSEEVEAADDCLMGEAQAIMEEIMATTEEDEIHMRTPVDKIPHMVRFLEEAKVLLGDDCFGKGKIVFDKWEAQSGVEEYDMNKEWEANDPYSQTEERQQSNVIMVDDEVTEEAEQSKTGDAEAVPQSIKEIPNDIFSILTKPQKIRSFTWQVSDMPGADLMNSNNTGPELFPWFMMTPQGPTTEECNGQNWKYLLSIFGFFRPGLRFFVKLNTIRANAGMLRLVWVPMCNASSPNPEMWYTFGNYPHVDIDASVSNSAELVVPFSHFRDFFPLCDDMNVEYSSLGALLLLVWNPLLVGTGTTPSVSGTVWACFDNPELHQPKWFSINQEFFTNQKREPVNQPYNSNQIRVVDLGEAQMDIISEGAALLDSGSKVVESVMKIAGNLVCDKPTSPAFPTKVGIQISDPPVQSSGSDHSVRLGLNPLGHIKNGQKYRQCVTDQTNLPYLIDNYNRVSVVPVSTSSNIWDKFWSEPVTPNLCIKWQADELKNSVVYPTTLAYISRMFGAWSGSLKYKFRAVVSDMHTVRFAIRYDPHTGSKSAVDAQDACSKEQSNIVIWDVSERKEIEVEIPFMSIRPVLRSGRFLSPGATYDEGVGLGVNGMLSLFLYQSLRCPSIASPTIEVNISIAAGSDFKLWYLIGINNVKTISGNPPKEVWASGTPDAYKKASRYGYQHIFFVRKLFSAMETVVDPSSKYYNIVNVSQAKWIKAWQDIMKKYPAAKNLRLNASYVNTSEPKPYVRNKEALMTTDYRMPGTDGRTVVPMDQIYALLAGMGSFEMFYWYFDRVQAVQMPLKGDLWYDFEPRNKYQFNVKIVEAQNYKVTDLGEAQSGVAEVKQTDKDAKKPTPKKATKAPTKVLPKRNPSSNIVKPIVLGKGRTLTTQDYVMGENWMNLRSLLKRFVCFRVQEVAPPFPDTRQVTYCFPVTPLMAETDEYNFSVTPLSAFAKLFTFWRGSLRYKFVVPGVPGLMMKAAYHPFTANGYGAWNSDYKTELILSPCGEVLYSGNVMGSLEVEIPFASLYQRLNCAYYKDLTSMAGCLFLTVVIPGSYNDKIVVRSYHAIGEDFEMMIPREVPVVELNPEEALIRLGDDSVIFPDGLAGISLNRQSRSHILNGNETITQPLRSLGRDPVWKGMTAQSGDEDIKPTTSGFQSNNADDGVNMIDDAVDGIIHAGKVVAEAAPRIEHSLASLVSVVSSLEKMSNLIPRVTDVVKKVGDAADGIQEASYDVSKFFNLGRIGVVVMGVYTFLTAEDLTTRMIALGGVGLAIGVGPEVASNCVNWVMSTLGWEEPVWKVPQRKEYDAGTAQSLGELIQDHSTAFKWCAASTAVMVFFTLFGGYPKKDDVADFSANWAAKLKNFHFAGQAIRTADWLFRWVSDVIQGALTWAFNLEAGGYLTRKLLADKCGDILEWVDRINDLDTDESMLQAIWDPNRQQDVWQLMDKGKELTELVTKNQKGGNLAVHINHGMRKLATIEKRICETTASLPSRIDPFCLCLYGQAGVGKSSLLATLVNYVADGLGYAKTNRVYSRNSCDKYWSRYVGQPIVVEDDFAQNVDGDDVAEFINLKSNFGMNLNMGDLNEKGRPFTSHFIFQTTNNAFPKPTIISDRQALWRRRDMLVKVTGTKTDDFSKLRFSIIDPIHEIERVIVKDINVEQLVNITVYVASHHLDEQRKLVWRDLNRGIVVLPPVDMNGLSEWERDVTKKAQTIIDLSNQAKEAGIPEPTPIKLKKKTVKIFDKARYAKAKKIGEHSRGKWESQAEHDEETSDDDDIEDVLCAAGALRSMSTRMSVSDAQKKILASDTDIQRYIDEVYRYSNVRPTVDAIKKAHERLFNRCKMVSDGLPIKKDIHDVVSGLLNDCHSYSDQLWSDVKKDGDKYVLDSKNEEVQLEWQLAEHELGDEEWQKVCDKRFNVPKVVKEEIFIIKKLKEAIESTKCWVRNWFNEHPRLFRAMKILCGFAGIFAGWKIVKWMMPEMCQKVEAKISEWFGVVADSKPVCYIREKTAPVTNKARGIVNKVSKKIKNLLGYEVEEEDFKDLLEKALDNYSEDEVAMVVESSTKEAIKKMASESKVYSISSSVRAPRSVHYGTAQSLMEAQGTCDKQAENLVSKCIARCLHRCKYELPTGKAAGVNVLALKGHCVLLPWHALETMEENQPVYFYRGGVTMTFLFDSSRVVRIGNTDAGIWNLGVKWPCAPDLSKHFIRESDLRVSRTMAELEILKAVDEFDGETRIQSHIVDVEVMSQVEYNLPDKSRRQNQIGWVYKANTVPGDCGGVLVAFNPRMQRKLLGIHTAGRVDDSMGFSVLLSGEMLDKAISELGEQFSGLPFTSQGAVYDEESFSRCKIIPNGNFSLVGVMRDDLSVGMQSRTSIRPSLLFDKVYHHKTEPAVQTPHDPRLETPISPMLTAINKYGNPTIPFNKNLIDYVTTSIAWDINNLELGMEKRLLTLFEVIYGNDLIPFCDRMNMASSPGYPYVLSRPSGEKGKAYLFDQDGIVDENLRNKYDLRESLARSGKRCESIWVDSLKDERRTLEKIKKGKTRQFTIPPVDFTMLMRKYFMSFAVTFYSNNVKFFSAVGIDPYSYQWTQLYFKLRKKSNLAIGGDFHAFDGIADPELYMRLCDIINDWYDDGPDNARVRKLLFHELIHTNHLCWNLLYFKHQGNPSGNPLTVVINTMMVVFYLRLTWLELANQFEPQKASITDYRENVEEICYGDDFLITVKGEIVEWFNMLTITQALSYHHIELTDENKGSSGVVEPIRHLDEMKFLKNRFLQHPRDHSWKLAAISQDTIQELINWVRESDDPVQTLKENIHDSFRFAYFWGESFYDKHCSLVNDAMRNINIEPILMSWASWDSHFRSLRA